jgi:phage-related protein
MKPIHWLGNTHKQVKEYPAEVKQEVGYQIDKIQRGEEPADWKVLSSVGHGVREIRIHAENEYRVIYVAKFSEAVYVLHTLVKKTQKTAYMDLQMAKVRYKEMLEMRDNL